MGVLLVQMAEWTGLEPATSGVTGQHSNQLNYHSAEPVDDTEQSIHPQHDPRARLFPTGNVNPAAAHHPGHGRDQRSWTGNRVKLVGAEGFEPPTLSV